jgi:two-component system, chemotaxis family, response regulator WspF
VRIGIVNDMRMAAEALKRALALAPEHEVAWIAGDGAAAVSACARDAPDLILMDLIMPGMDGVEATRRIMAATPCPILIVTVSVENNAGRVFEAMGFGALDAVDTPALGSSDVGAAARPLLAKIAALARLTGSVAKPPALVAARRDGHPSRRALVAIGASAGGPGALAVLLGGLPADFPAAIVIVQHVDQRFAAGMADWLSQQSSIPVKLAREGDRPVPGTALLAGTDHHLIFATGERLGYTREPAEAVYRPSVDVFFESVVRRWTGRVLAILLTGMGSDGAVGLKALRGKGHHTIAQDKATSAVYGMPKAAAAIGAAVEILPLERIAPRLASLLQPDAARAALPG